MKWGSKELTTRVKYRVLGTTELSGRVKNGVEGTTKQEFSGVFRPGEQGEQSRATTRLF